MNMSKGEIKFPIPNPHITKDQNYMHKTSKFKTQKEGEEGKKKERKKERKKEPKEQ